MALAISITQLLLVSVFTLQTFVVSGSTRSTTTTMASSTQTSVTSNTSTSTNMSTESTSDTTPITTPHGTTTNSGTNMSSSTLTDTTTTAASMSSNATSSTTTTNTSSPISPTSYEANSSASSNTTAMTTGDDNTTNTSTLAQGIIQGTWQWYALVIAVPAAGGIVLLVIIIVVNVVCCRRRKRHRAVDADSKSLGRVVAPNGDLYTQVVVKGQGYQAIEMASLKAGNGTEQEYLRLSMGVPNDVNHDVRHSRMTTSAFVTASDGQAMEAKICQESGEAQPAERIKDKEDCESAFVNPLAGGDYEGEYENCSDYLNKNRGDGNTFGGTVETEKPPTTPTVKIVPLKMEKSLTASEKEKSPRRLSRDDPKIDVTPGKKRPADQDPKAPEEQRPDSDVYENSSVVRDVTNGFRREEGAPGGLPMRSSMAADDSQVAKQPGGLPMRSCMAADDSQVAKQLEPSQTAGTKEEDFLEDNVLYESSLSVQHYNSAADAGGDS